MIKKSQINLFLVLGILIIIISILMLSFLSYKNNLNLIKENEKIEFSNKERASFINKIDTCVNKLIIEGKKVYGINKIHLRK